MNKILLKFRYALCCIFLILSSVNVSAQEQLLLGWQFFDTKNGGKSAGDEPTYNSSKKHNGVENSVLSRGSGLDAYALQTGFSSVPAVLTTDYAAAYAGHSYYEFGYQSKANFETSLTKIDYKIRLSGTWSDPAGQPFSYQWHYSLNGGASFLPAGPAVSISAATNTNGVVQTPLNLALVDNLQEVTGGTSVIFRMYVWGFTNKVGTGTFGIGRSGSATEYSLSLSGTVKNSNPITEAYFTDLKSVARNETSNVILDKLVSMIDGTPAGEAIYMSIYLINNQSVLDALKAAETRGVNLHIIVDMSREDSQTTNATSLPWLQNNLTSSEVITCVNDVASYAINHHKFVLFSSINTPEGVMQNVTLQTSHNFTNSDAKKAQDALVLNNLTIYQAYLANWNTLKTYASSGMRQNYQFNTSNDLANGVSVSFFPKIGAGVNSSEDEILLKLNTITDVNSAKVRVAMSDWTNSRSAIVDKLIALKNQGATIEVYAKESIGNQIEAKLSQLKNLGATVRVFNFETGGDARMNIHAKMMLIEGKYNGQANAKVVITGSHNFTEPALNTNNEALLTLINSSVFDDYSNYFDELNRIMPSAKILSFNVFGSTGSQDTYPSSFNAGVKPSLLQRGVGIVKSSLNNAFSSSKTNLPTAQEYAEAVTSNAYIEIPIQIRAGKKLSLYQLDAMLRRSAGGSKKLQWAYVLNGSAPRTIGDEFTIIDNTVGQSIPSVDLSNISDLQGLTAKDSFSIRLYLAGESAAGGTFAFGVATAATPEVLVLRGNVETIADENIILAWSAGALSGETTSFTSNNISGYVNAATVIRGAALDASSLSSGFSSKTSSAITFSDVTDYDSAKEKGSYLEFNLDVKGNSKVSLSSIEAKLRRSGAGANRYVWTYSLDGTTYVDINTTPVSLTGSATTGVYQPSIDVAGIGALQNIVGPKIVKFRLYIWGATSAAGSFAFGLSESPSEDVLLITGTSVLPVTLTSFEVRKQNNSAKLIWTTAAEINNDRFEVLRSNDGSVWNTIAKVKGNGTTNSKNNYSFVDQNPKTGVNYYQLKQVDFDGKATLSEIKTLQFKIAQPLSATAYYTNNAVSVLANGFAKGKATVVLYNLNGQKLGAQEFTISDSSTKVLLPANLNTGVYLVKITGTNEQLSIKLIANN